MLFIPYAVFDRAGYAAKARALYVLRGNWEAVQEIATALLEQETLSGVALEALLSPVREFRIGDIPVPEQPERA